MVRTQLAVGVYWDSTPLTASAEIFKDIQTRSKVPLGLRVFTQHRQWAMMGLIVIILLLFRCLIE
uniref:Predicted protein n=1 Tax=Hordeum vulgare subsp. vulgare TaxID=112509 RepID=F2EBG3_HORVV|nr:predicted protein [Hordeum vulgare subsp. vulgare]